MEGDLQRIAGVNIRAYRKAKGVSQEQLADALGVHRTYMGGVERGGKTSSIWLRSGDVVVMSGAARLAHHGIDRIRFGTSPLMPRGGRINLTLRVVD